MRCSAWRPINIGPTESLEIIWGEKVGLNMHGGPKDLKTRKGQFKAVRLWFNRTFPSPASPCGHFLREGRKGRFKGVAGNISLEKVGLKGDWGEFLSRLSKRSA